MRWSNVPIPEPHVAAVLVAASLHYLLPLRLPLAGPARWVSATALVGAGVGLAAWAVVSAGEADVESDAALVTEGAFALTRNPMYLGWSTAVLGLAAGTRSAWLLGAWVLAVAALDREIRIEESRLGVRFGAAYAAYRTRVPRYLTSGSP